jgi:Fe2+ or Zn2+ uptake regulation protein
MSTTLSMESTKVRNAIWRHVFAEGIQCDTRQLKSELKLPAKTIYANMKSLEKQKFIEVIPPTKSGQPCAITLHPSKAYLNSPTA